MPLSLLIAVLTGFFYKNPLNVEETALLHYRDIYKGVNFAVMADMNYDGLRIF